MTAPFARARSATRPGANRRRDVLITGGAGFVGTNLARRLVADGRSVLLLDDLSRPGVEENAALLAELYGDRVELAIGDVRDRERVRDCVARVDTVYHFAAQVAVTTSVVDPRLDFTVNAAGALEVLEAVRQRPRPPGLVFTSTNKVYGSLDDVELRREGGRYRPVSDRLDATGIDERRPLDFHSPYGCSKGAADQYVLDYARTYGLPTVVLRMSCIYGRHQFGTEDQGWVAHFLKRAVAGQPITVYGDGCQVRDVLFADDLADAMVLAGRRADELAGRAFNLGGGPENTLSLRELLAFASELEGAPVEADYDDWRPGDQRWYVSDFRAFEAATGWRPRVGVSEGVAELHRWLRDASPLVATVEAEARAAQAGS